MKKLVLPICLLLFPSIISALALLPMDDPEQSKGIPDNIVYDIVEHQNAVWVATNSGVSFKYFNDSTWNIYDVDNGLVSNMVASIWSDNQNNILWIATNHVVYGNDPDSDEDDYTFADGLSFTLDEGFTWVNDSIYTDTLEPVVAFGPFRTIYDITGHDETIFGASFFGGLFGSFDGGANWKRIYYTALDSTKSIDPDVQPPNSNKYFAAVVDTLHPDSLVLWAGSAAGLRRFVYAPPNSTPASSYNFDLTSVGDYVYISGESGITRLKFDSVAGAAYLPEYHSAFMSDGLPGMSVTTAFGFGGRLFVGTLDSTWLVWLDTLSSTYVFGDGSGLAISDDDGVSFHTNYTGLVDLIGQNRYAREFASVGNNLFLAGYEAGLFVSSDTGQTWVKLDVDTLDPSPSNPRNVVHSLAADSANLWVGTDSGLVLIRFDGNGVDTLHEYFVFDDGPDSGARSYKVAVQHFSDSAETYDSVTIWTINQPVDTINGNLAIYYSIDYGANWTETRPYKSPEEIPYFDIEFSNDVTLLAGEDIYSYSNDRTGWTKFDANFINQNIWGRRRSFNNLNLNSILLVADTIYIGSETGFAYSPPPEDLVTRWYLIFPNKDATHFDNVINYTYPYVSGNFVNALAIQPLPLGQSRIWASTRPGQGGASEFVGVSTSTIDGLSWRQIPGMECWNFDFNGPEVFAASSGGLVYSPDTGMTWDTLKIVGQQMSSDPPVDVAMDMDTITAVRVIGDTLWVGTLGGGIAKASLDDIFTEYWDIYRVYDPSTILYAYPIPFSHASNSFLYFHFNAPTDAYVTLEVYDFAMDLVRTVVDNEFRIAGIYSADRWDGRNGRGDNVAVGVYYFKLSFSTGETFWGKLAINP